MFSGIYCKPLVIFVTEGPCCLALTTSALSWLWSKAAVSCNLKSWKSQQTRIMFGWMGWRRHLQAIVDNGEECQMFFVLLLVADNVSSASSSQSRGQGSHSNECMWRNEPRIQRGRPCYHQRPYQPAWSWSIESTEGPLWWQVSCLLVFTLYFLLEICLYFMFEWAESWFDKNESSSTGFCNYTFHCG